MNTKQWAVLGALGLSLMTCASAPKPVKDVSDKAVAQEASAEEVAPEGSKSILDHLGAQHDTKPVQREVKPRMGKVTLEGDVRISGPIDPEHTAQNITRRRGWRFPTPDGAKATVEFDLLFAPN